ncbi:MAG: BMP family ABC transporter substrate-binding protein [Clostridia bacterium]|nr:BMP family ABC transporter substrate-binding protein [Clostridia bacterium]
MKKLLLLVLVACLALTTFALVACDNEPAEEIDVALITDVGTIDDQSFNQAAWEGVKAYCEANNKLYRYYQPISDSDEERVKSIRKAIVDGADIVVCPGYMFENAIKEVMTTYPDVNFLFLDGYMGDTNANVHCVSYNEEQVGFLAGYAAVMDGYTSLGFLGGMAVPAVERFGYGYIQGIDYAANVLQENVSIKYTYGGQFFGDATITAKMEGWYQTGTEIVFACGGGIYTSVIEAAAKYTDAMAIGVDSDQGHLSELFLTSAMKDLKNTVVTVLGQFYGGEWDTIGGTSVYVGLLEGDYVGLPTTAASWRFASFTVEQYNAVVAEIRAGTITISNDTTAYPVVSAYTTLNVED